MVARDVDYWDLSPRPKCLGHSLPVARASTRALVLGSVMTLYLYLYPERSLLPSPFKKFLVKEELVLRWSVKR